MANALTLFRLVGAPFLLFCPLGSPLFYVLYLFCGVSDVLDGLAARHLGRETPLGARLDTAADAVFFAVVLLRVLPALSLPLWVYLWIGSIALIKCAAALTGFVRYRRFVPEHTAANKLCGVLLFLLPLCLSHPSFTGALVHLTCTAATFAAVQEAHCIRTGREIR